MVKITNGVNLIEVSKGAFENIYKAQGYYIPKDSKKPLKEHTEPIKDVKKEVVDDITKKPLSKWTKDEVKKYANDYNIDISNTKNVNEAKDIISEYLEG